MTDNTQAPVPSDILEVQVNGEKRELFMSFGLLNELTVIVGDPTQVSSLPINPPLRDKVFIAILAKRKKSGKIEENIDIDDVEISIEDAEKAMRWTQEHLMSFFVRSLRQVMEISKNHEKEVTNLSSYLDGSKDSASKKP